MPTEEEREALAAVLYVEQYGGPFSTADGDLLGWADVADEHRVHFYDQVDEVIRAGWRPQGDVTDEEVEAAAEAIRSSVFPEHAPLAKAITNTRWADHARAALTAAKEARG